MAEEQTAARHDDMLKIKAILGTADHGLARGSLVSLRRVDVTSIDPSATSILRLVGKTLIQHQLHHDGPAAANCTSSFYPGTSKRVPLPDHG